MEQPKPKSHLSPYRVVFGVDDSATTLQRFAEMYEQKILCDICLVVQGSKFPCHRFILCSSSEVFQVMIGDTHWKESGQYEVELVESPECVELFDSFLRYLYTGRIDLTLDSVMHVLLLADKYNVNRLVEKCYDMMTSEVARALVDGHLMQWLQYAQLSGNDSVARQFRCFLIWNANMMLRESELATTDVNLLCSLLQESDLVVHNELALFWTARDWLELHAVDDEDEMEALVYKVMSHIRFPMISSRQITDIIPCPLAHKYPEYFLGRMKMSIDYHSGELSDSELLRDPANRDQIMPRVYTENKYATLHSVENFRCLTSYHMSTLIFTSQVSSAEHESHAPCEWVVSVYPKGVRIDRHYLITFAGNIEVPEQVMKTVRLSIYCKEPPRSSIKAKVAILIYGLQGDIECVCSVTQRVHHFSEIEPVLNIDNLLPFDALNVEVGHYLERPVKPSRYLTGPERNILKMHVVIEPLPQLRH